MGGVIRTSILHPCVTVIHKTLVEVRLNDLYCFCSVILCPESVCIPLEAAPGGALLKKLFLKISQYSQENIFVGVSF